MFLLSLGNKKMKYQVNKHVLTIICSDVSLRAIRYIKLAKIFVLQQ